MLLDIFDPKAPPRAVGIDLGTTQSVAAYVRDGRPATVLTCDGGAQLPSAVYYGRSGETIVGRVALSHREREPERTIVSAKRLMGRRADDPQTQQLSALRFATAEGDHGRVVRFDLGGETKTPVEVSADILRSLKQSAEEQLRTLGGVVITVPAYFDDGQRQATKDAAALAGLNVLRLLNEPTAAALAYGLERNTTGTYAIYDLGGGTFDVTVLSLEDGVFQVRSTGGDSALGGDDMDRAIAEHLLTRLGFDSTQAPPAVVALALSEARKAKHQLSASEAATAELPDSRGQTRSVSLTRAQLETWIQPLLERTGRAVRRALRDAELAASDLDGVILVGGATRVPRVQQYVEEVLGQAPLCELDPDLVVAYGAALQAEQLSQGSDESLLLDVLPLSLGVETMGGAVDRILPRNTTIPVSARATFTTYADGQTGFELHVVQGERELAKDCRSLARFTLRGIPPLPAGQARLEVHFDVDENSLLTVRAKELSTGVEQQVVVQPSHGLTDDEVEQMLIEALDQGEEDLEARRLVEAKVEASRVLAATESALKADGDLLEPSERAAIDEAVARLKAAIEQAGKASRIESRVQALDEATHAFAGRRMDRAFQSALEGQQVDQLAGTVAEAKGVDAHLEEHQRANNP